MTAQTWIWVHGASATVEFPADFPELPGPPAQVPFRSISRGSPGLELSPPLPGIQHSVFIPIATTTLLDDVFQRLSAFALLYRTTDATIDSVAPFDGVKQIATFPNLAWTGAHLAVDGTNTLFLPKEVDVTSGVLAAVSVTFAQSSRPQTGAISGSLLVVGAGLRLVAGETRLQRFLRTIGAVFTGQ